MCWGGGAEACAGERLAVIRAYEDPAGTLRPARDLALCPGGRQVRPYGFLNSASNAERASSGVASPRLPVRSKRLRRREEGAGVVSLLRRRSARGWAGCTRSAPRCRSSRTGCTSGERRRTCGRPRRRRSNRGRERARRSACSGRRRPCPDRCRVRAARRPRRAAGAVPTAGDPRSRSRSPVAAMSVLAIVAHEDAVSELYWIIGRLHGRGIRPRARALAGGDRPSSGGRARGGDRPLHPVARDRADRRGLHVSRLGLLVRGPPGPGHRGVPQGDRHGPGLRQPLQRHRLLPHGAGRMGRGDPLVRESQGRSALRAPAFPLPESGEAAARCAARSRRRSPSSRARCGRTPATRWRSRRSRRCVSRSTDRRLRCARGPGLRPPVLGSPGCGLDRPSPALREGAGPAATGARLARVRARPSTWPPSLRSGSRNASRFARPDSRNLVALRTIVRAPHRRLRCARGPGLRPPVLGSPGCGLDRAPGPLASLRLPQRESFRSPGLAKLGRVADDSKSASRNARPGSSPSDP